MSDDQAQATSGVAASGSSGAAASEQPPSEARVGPFVFEYDAKACGLGVSTTDELLGWSECVSPEMWAEFVAALAESADCTTEAALVEQLRAETESWKAQREGRLEAELRVGRLEEALREAEDVARIAITWAPWGNAIGLRSRLAAALVRTGEEHGQGQIGEARVPRASGTAQAGEPQ